MYYNKRKKVIFQATKQSIKMSKKEEEYEEYSLLESIFSSSKSPPCHWIVRQVERLGIAQYALSIPALVQAQANRLWASWLVWLVKK